MSPNAESEHVDMLLALALAFGETAADRAGETDAAVETDAAESRGPLEVFSALNPAVRQAVERRAGWYARLPRQKQRDWLAHMLAPARERTSALQQLDEHVHPSHVVEALRDEPTRVREFVVRHLPPPLAAAVAAQLGIAYEAGDEVLSRSKVQAGGMRPRHPEAGAGDPPPGVAAVVRREFLSRFENLPGLARTTPLEFLSGVELARLVRLLGVRETALACRGIEAVEAVASFLRRFATEDARAIAAHIASLTEVDPQRVASAGQHLRATMLAESDPGAMLDRVGLRLLALSLAARADAARLRYTAQKLPPEAARWLEDAARAASAEAARDARAREMLRAVESETEAVAAGLRRSHSIRHTGQAAHGVARPTEKSQNEPHGPTDKQRVEQR